VHPIARNAVVFVGIGVIWIFLFAPNPWLSFLNVQGHERLSAFPWLALAPAALAVISMLATTGTLLTRIALTLCVPLLSYASHLLLWLTGIYVGEQLLGGWMLMFLPIPSYLIGLAAAAFLVWRSRNGRERMQQQPPHAENRGPKI